MAKIICTNATVKPLSELYSLPVDRPLIYCEKVCPVCQGNGYIEAEMVEVEPLKTWIAENTCYPTSCDGEEFEAVYVVDLLGRLTNG